MQKLTALIVLFAVCAFQPPQPKTLKVEFTTQDWNAIINVIEQSNAPYQEVKSVKENIIKQLQKQLTDTTKQKK